MKIGIDLDDTLCDFTNPFINYLNENYNSNLRKEQVTTYMLEKILQITPIETENRLKKFYKTNYFKNIQPIKDSIEIINLLPKSNELSILSLEPKWKIAFKYKKSQKLERSFGVN